MNKESRALMDAAVALMKLHRVPVLDPDTDPWPNANSACFGKSWQQAEMRADPDQMAFPIHLIRAICELERTDVRPLNIIGVSAEKAFQADTLLLNLMLQLAARGHRAGIDVRRTDVDQDFLVEPKFTLELTVYA